ncbi:MAG: exodeoxyribonuclease III [Hyphomicrobiales bacterium]
MKIATWNVNGIKARIEGLLAWLDDARPDMVCLQEIKSVDEAFPGHLFEERGYNVATHGQKSFNGVAVLSRYPFDEVARRLPGDDTDEQARFLAATVSTAEGALTVASLYCPNGNPLGTEKFTYKLGWMERLEAHVRRMLADETPFVLAGDYNIIPEPGDAKNPDAWLGDALFQPESRAAWRRLLGLGLVDALRSTTDADGLYTFWDYQAGAWQKNNGIRIDHALLSPQAADRLSSVLIDKRVRGWERPSDHVPLIIDLDIGER